MELRQLRYFVGVCEVGSLLKASRLLHVAQPALSQQIASLESELGATLFARSSRGMALTDSGRQFLAHARVVLADVERARISVQQGDAELSGEVSIGLPTSVGLMATLSILQALRSRFPAVRPHMIEAHSGFLREWLQSGRLDMCLLFGMGQESWLLQRPLLSEQLCLVGARQDGGRRLSRSIPLSEIPRYPLFLPGRGHGLRRIIDDVCALHDVRLDVIGELDSLPNIKKAVEAGMACTVLSPAAVAEEVQAGRLETATIADPAIDRTVVYATSLTRPLTPAAAAVGELVCESVQDLVRSGYWRASLAIDGMENHGAPSVVPGRPIDPRASLWRPGSARTRVPGDSTASSRPLSARADEAG